jgi:hypothetical protein
MASDPAESRSTLVKDLASALLRCGASARPTLVVMWLPLCAPGPSSWSCGAHCSLVETRALHFSETGPICGNDVEFEAMGFDILATGGHESFNSEGIGTKINLYKPD